MDNTVGGVSFLVDDELSSNVCRVCQIAFDEKRQPRKLECGHGFCEECAFSIQCHQQYYLLDSMHCPVCHGDLSVLAPSTTDSSKCADETGCESNATVIHLAGAAASRGTKRGAVGAGARIGKGAPSSSSSSSSPLPSACKQLANSSQNAKHKRCGNCTRKLSNKSLDKVSRLCETCSTPTSFRLVCLECCVNSHNGHVLLRLADLEKDKLTTLAEVRSIRTRCSQIGSQFDLRWQLLSKTHQIPTFLKSDKEQLLASSLMAIDESIKQLESCAIYLPSMLRDIRCRHMQSISRMTKMANAIDKHAEIHSGKAETKKEHALSSLSTSSFSRRQSRLTLNDDSTCRSALSSLLRVLPRASKERVATCLSAITPKDTAKQRAIIYIECAREVTKALAGEDRVELLMMYADALLHSFFELNSLSRKTADVSRKIVWKTIQLAYTDVLRVAAKNYPSYHPDRVDLVDDLAFLCRLYADVCDYATVTICMIEAARARASEQNLDDEQRERAQQRLTLIDEHLLECRRQQKLIDLRQTRAKNRVKTLWRTCRRLCYIRV